MRTAQISRATNETRIKLSLNLDGEGRANVRTGVAFLDHMLDAFAVHSGFDITLECDGDHYIDSHHTAEDAGIALGMAFLQALGDKRGIARYGSFTLPMDECLVSVDCDVCGRSYLVFNAEFKNDRIGTMESDMVEHFFRSFAMNANMTLHVNLRYGVNDHHKAEGIFKAAAHAIALAAAPTAHGRILSSKGVI